TLAPGTVFRHPVAPAHNAFVYLYEGACEVGEPDARRPLPPRSAGVLSGGDSIELAAGPEGARLLLLSARPLGEPVAQYGPFVMNTSEEVEQAIRDYQAGRLTAP